jgi:hypothetical protein
LDLLQKIENLGVAGMKHQTRTVSLYLLFLPDLEKLAIVVSNTNPEIVQDF